jgi:hypothetical protein
VLKSGWRPAWAGVGWFLLLVLAPLAAIVIRNNPEDKGLQLDGDPEPPSQLADLTIWTALSSPAFWVFGLSSSVFGLVYSGIALFNQSILEQRGLTRLHTTRFL